MRPVPGEWTRDAACHGQTAVFFPRRGDTATMRAAKAICATCPVLDRCQDHLLTVNERYGIWGGMTEPERRHWRKQHRAAGIRLQGHGTRACYVRGCRCDLCTDANVRYRRNQRR